MLGANTPRQQRGMCSPLAMSVYCKAGLRTSPYMRSKMTSMKILRMPTERMRVDSQVEGVGEGVVGGGVIKCTAQDVGRRILKVQTFACTAEQI